MPGATLNSRYLDQVYRWKVISIPYGEPGFSETSQRFCANEQTLNAEETT